jgi:hypothetical protein
MTDNAKDIFGQIDALLGKRNPEILADKPVADDDFPMLTEVIESPIEAPWCGQEERQRMRQADDRRVKERRVAHRRAAIETPVPATVSSHELNSMLELLDQRLSAHMQMQQQKFEESLRQAVREILRENKV